MKKSDLTKLIAIGAAVTAAAATTAIVISKHKKHKTMLAEHKNSYEKAGIYHRRRTFCICVSTLSCA